MEIKPNDLIWFRFTGKENGFSGNKSLNLNYAYMSYAKNKYGSFSVPQLEGKSEEYYLIAEDGEVTYIN